MKLFVTYEGGGFKKGGLRGSKNENFEKIPPKPKRVEKIGYQTCATLPKRRKLFFKVFVTYGNP